MILKVLHIWNTCGIGGLLARYMDMQFDIQSDCIMSKPVDRLGFANEKVHLIGDGRLGFHLRSFLAAREYDILHFHAMDRYLPLYRMFNQDKRIIMHYHGSNIRGRWVEREKFWKYADQILVSTKDLLEGSPPEVIHLPNVINEELCRMNSFRDKKKGLGLHCDERGSEIAKQYAEDYRIRLEIHNRKRTPMKHIEFIKHLSSFEYYIDVKKDKATESYHLPELSLTGYEALMCKCKVIQFNGRLLSRFPEENLAVNVTKKLFNIYEGFQGMEETTI